MDENLKRVAAREALAELEKNRYVFSEETVQQGLKALELCKELDHREGMAASLVILAQLACYLNDNQNSLYYSYETINIAQELNICDLQVLGYLNIGFVCFDMKDYEKSYEYFQAALRLMDIFNHSKNYYTQRDENYYLSKIYTNLGELYRIHELFSQADKYYSMAFICDESQEFRGTMGLIFINLAHIRFHMKQYQEAIDNLIQAISYLDQFEFENGKVEAYDLMALTYDQLGEFELAKENFNKAIHCSDKIDYVYSKLDLYIHYAEFLDRHEQYYEAIAILRTAYAHCEEVKYYDQGMEICKQLIRFYKKVNQNEMMNYYYSRYFENEKMLVPIQKAMKTKQFELKVQFDELEEEKREIFIKSERFRKETDELTQTISNISAIGQMGSKLTTSTELTMIYEMLWNAITEFMQPDAFGIALFNEESGMLDYQFYMEKGQPIVFNNTHIDDTTSIAAKSLRDKEIIVLEDLHNEYLCYLEDENYLERYNCFDIGSALFCPLMIDGQRIGLFTVQSYMKNFFTVLRLESIKAFASYASIAINNAIKSKRLFDEIQKSKLLQEELKHTNDRLMYLSEHDPLTGLPNRRRFDVMHTMIFAEAVRKQSDLALAIFDIDYFKQYNDLYGHGEGDHCLHRVGRVAKKLSDKNIFIARIGGDEFVMLIQNHTKEEVVAICENLRKRIYDLGIEHKGSTRQDVVTITMGVFVSKADDTKPVSYLMNQADQALYEAKDGGRNRVVMKGLSD